ncbi:MAG: HlyD family efflux transporter periplasmic adaptor subunit [Roseiflexus sp.]|nr:HlyD family efflux transporter periplasmic adaptor subunit [Roseiflexus sp.]MCS7289796.1 HlyD family efflux transporter periplasmic adaptor subunit [Roseiflexus sp.]MDW8145721.1 HlyD family efflux transporter periplasmic adaptor subunit [Roseiflexaceae bacterium]MDW8232489.1 HlyD family efflux transporter periplasmic adaptor subunit [Roseiflexaceae bacterium]
MPISRIAAGALAIVLLIGGALVAYSRTATPSRAEASAESAPPPIAVQATHPIVASGIVAPASHVDLRVEQRGIVREVLVREGDMVRAGDPLLRLDTSELELRLAQARANLAAAQASYELLASTATPADIQRAQANLARAQARLREVSGAVTPHARAAAQARLDAARAVLARLEAGPNPADVRALRAELRQAEADLQATRDRLALEKTTLRLQMEQAANLLRDRQTEYARVRDENQARSEPLTAEQRTREISARLAMENAEKALEQARVAYEAALQAERTGIAAAEARVEAARARLDRALTGPDPDQLAAARAAVAQAEDDLARLRGEQRAGAIEAARAEVAIAEAELERLLAGARPAEAALARARVEEAEVALKQAELALERAILRAPIAGVVASLNIKAGEVADPQLIAVRLADVRTWRVETTNLSELSVTRLREGDPAIIRLNSMPGLEIPGKVTGIKPLGTSQDGDVTLYTVFITPDRVDERLRWNMTAQVQITPQHSGQ